jgi:hypothetical protein
MQDLEASYLRRDSTGFLKGGFTASPILRQDFLTWENLDYKEGCFSEALLSEYKGFHPILGRALRFVLP